MQKVNFANVLRYIYLYTTSIITCFHHVFTKIKINFILSQISFLTNRRPSRIGYSEPDEYVYVKLLDLVSLRVIMTSH